MVVSSMYVFIILITPFRLPPFLLVRCLPQTDGWVSTMRGIAWPRCRVRVVVVCLGRELMTVLVTVRCVYYRRTARTYSRGEVLSVREGRTGPSSACVRSRMRVHIG